MKVRERFVANSSTSSFVVLGVRAEVEYEWAEEHGLFKVPETDIVGFQMAEDDDWGMSDSEYTLQDIVVKAKVLKSLLGDGVDIRLFSGTHVS